MSSIGLEIHGTRPITISVATFRKLSGLGNTKVYELIKNGTLETVLVGRKRLITFRSVERLLLPETASEAPRGRGRPRKSAGDGHPAAAPRAKGSGPWRASGA